MAKFSYVVDVAVYQPDSLDYFKKLKGWGARGAVVKLTEGSESGSRYINPKSATQIKNAGAAGLKVSAYHYFLGNGTGDSQDEAKWFLKYLEANHIPKNNPVVCDVEEVTLSGSPTVLTSYVNAFFEVLKSAGYTCLYLYTGTYFGETRLHLGSINAHLWVASYPTIDAVTAPYTAYAPTLKHSVWQFTSNWHGIHVDASVDYVGHFTSTVTKTPKKKTYYTGNPKLVKALEDGVGVYHDKDLKHLYKKVKAGKQYETVGIVKSSHGAYRIKLKAPKNDYYISARSDLWKNMYYMDNPGYVEVIARKGMYIYRSKAMKRSDRVQWFGKGTSFKIVGMTKTPAGTSIMKTESGFYITANKNYVKKMV